MKGYTSAELLWHPDRLLSPLVRSGSGALVPASWAEALERIVRRIRELQAKHGQEAMGIFGSGALTNEKAYLLGKFARVCLRTPNIDYNGRFCMSSAAAASNQAFGLDRGLPFPLEWIAGADVVLLAGGNSAETMPPLMQYFEDQKARGGRLIVVDPRRSATADAAWRHLPITPGTDAALAHGLLHILIRDGLVDQEYVARRTEGFARVRALVAGYWPARVERITGIPEALLTEVAHAIGTAGSAMVLTGRGPEQQSRGVSNVGAYINLALAVGAVGKGYGGYGCLTGQGNGQGGREHGQKADQLPGYRDIRDPTHRREVAAVWGVPEETLPGPGRSAQELLGSIGEPDGIRGLLVFGANPLVSAPDAIALKRRLRSLDLLVVSDFFLSETASLADVVLPSAQWAEEDGTMTNLEGRVIRRRRVFAPPEGVRTDLEILVELADRLGSASLFPSASPEHVFDELRRATSGGRADYGGITYERIDRENGVQWPCRTEDEPGTKHLFADGFPTKSGRARFWSTDLDGAGEMPDDEYPFFLTTGRLLGHYQTGTQTRRVARLQAIAPGPVARIPPGIARLHGLVNGSEVVLETRRGNARFRVEVNPGQRTDTIFVPFHWGGEGSVNRLTSPCLDPISRMPSFKVCAVRIEGAGARE